jgi:hypothetical protein
LSEAEDYGLQASGSQDESGMQATAIAANSATRSAAVRLAANLAEKVFELVAADLSGRMVQRKRLGLPSFATALEN